jgi:hypothetical protein
VFPFLRSTSFSSLYFFRPKLKFVFFLPVASNFNIGYGTGLFSNSFCHKLATPKTTILSQTVGEIILRLFSRALKPTHLK